MKKRWDEVIALVNDNAQNLICKGLFDELLRFLIQNMDHKTNEAHIIMDGGTVTVCNDKLVPFKNDSNADVIHMLIDVAPRRVFIHQNANLEKKLVRNIENIFCDCVTIDYANN